VLPPVSSLIAK